MRDADRSCGCGEAPGPRSLCGELDPAGAMAFGLLRDVAAGPVRWKASRESEGVRSQLPVRRRGWGRRCKEGNGLEAGRMQRGGDRHSAEGGAPTDERPDGVLPHAESGRGIK